MGDPAFQRVGSRVWWTDDGAGDADAAAAVATERSSPSSSHRSADSGFSDRSASPGGGCVANPFLGRLDLSCFDNSPRDRKNNKKQSPQSPSSTGHDALDFTGVDGPPAHTSTPKVRSGASPRLRRLCAKPLDLSTGLNSLCEVTGATSAAGAPVRRWLAELVGASEPECTTALQSKSLAADLGRQVAAAAAAATNSVRTLQERTRRIAAEFNKLSRQLELDTMEHLGPLVQSLTGHVAEFARQQQHQQSSGRGSAAETLDHACNGLREAAAEAAAAAASATGGGGEEGGGGGAHRERLRADARALGSAFTAVVDDTLLTHIGVLVAVLEAPASEMALRAALAALAALGLEGRRLSALVAEAGGVRALLAVVLESRCSSVRAAALRALAAVACAPDAIRSLEQAGGIEVLAELLVDESRPEPELAEAAAVLAQTTAPWVDDNPGVHGLSDHLHPIIHALTGLAERTKSPETLLLAAAALANVTYMEPRAVWALLASGSAGRLLQAVRRLGAEASVFLQEQAAALLAAMAAVPESRAPLADQRAVVALLCFLQVRASPLQEQPEIAAAERLQHKSAIALSRLCSDPAVAEQVVELQGVPRLIRLCRDERERNHSDGVLVACLAALRKIAANCGNQIIEDFGALELVEPRLLDSFLLYSSRQESYV